VFSELFIGTFFSKLFQYAGNAQLFAQDNILFLAGHLEIERGQLEHDQAYDLMPVVGIGNSFFCAAWTRRFRAHNQPFPSQNKDIPAAACAAAEATSATAAARAGTVDSVL
jgi:hypothetical protein